MRKKSVFIAVFFFFITSNPIFSEDYEEIANKILTKGLEENGAYAILEKLTKLGPRLTGSPQASAAIELMRQILMDIGLDARLEPVQVSRWIRGEKEEGRLVSQIFGTMPVSICALGGSVPTPDNGISAEVVEVESIHDLKSIDKDINGKIVFFNKKMNPAHLNPFRAYGEAAEQRVFGAIESAKMGASAVIVRSLTLTIDEYPHTGIMNYLPDVKKIPAVAISTRDAEVLSKFLKHDPSLKVYLKVNCKELPPVISYNVIGEIKGYKRPSEIILIGAHLDSWDLGEGAHDDGAGCAHVVEALRLLKELGIKPKRTIRGVLFMDEESGATGGRAYASSKEREKEKHMLAIESDSGGFLPLYIGIRAKKSQLDKLKKLEKILLNIGIQGIREGGGGADIAPLEKLGSILSSLIVNSQKYFDYHHCAKDVLSSVHPRELELGAIAMAVFSYLVAEEGI